MIRLHFFHDRASLIGLPKKIKQQITNRNLVVRDNSQLISFCGMIVDSTDIFIFLPRSSSVENRTGVQKQKIASQLMQAIERYGKQSSTKIDLQDEGEGRIELRQLSLIKLLLEDYRNYGLYSRRQILQSKKLGKVDWRKTIARSTHFPNQYNQPIYLELYCQHQRYLSDTEVSRIHADIIKKLDQQYSWLFGKASPDLRQELGAVPKPRGDKEYQLAVLNRELGLTYSEREIYLIRQLILFLKNYSGTACSNFITGLTRFHYAWEHMLSHVIENTININSKLPAPVYISQDGQPVNAFEKGMRTDIVVRHPEGKEFTIIDAKYYKASKVSDAPGWSDLVKQFFYVKALETVYPNHKINNMFIFPGERQIFSRVRMRSRKNQQLFLDDKFSTIECKYVCPLNVIEHFVKNKKITISKL